MATQQILATVNINMGLQQNPTLTLTPSTNVHHLVSDFIQKYQLPQSAYEAIMGAITLELKKVQIQVGGEGALIKMGKRRENKENSPFMVGGKGKKDTVSWDVLKAQKINNFNANSYVNANGNVNNNKIQITNHKISPVYPREQNQTKVVNKVGLFKAKSPLRMRETPQTQLAETWRSKSPIQSKTPNKDRILVGNRNTEKEKYNESEILSQIFDILIKNQPKSIRVLSPEFISFTGIRPEVLTILQDFFQVVQEHEFLNMDRLYFMARMRQLNLTQKLVTAVLSQK